MFRRFQNNRATPALPPPTHVDLGERPKPRPPSDPPTVPVSRAELEFVLEAAEETSAEPRMFPFNFHPESGKTPRLELDCALVIWLPAIPLGDGFDAITEVYLRIPKGTCINYHSPKWRWRRDLIMAHFGRHTDLRLRSRSQEWAARALNLDKPYQPQK